MMDMHLIAYYIGIFVIFASHIYMIVTMPTQPMLVHSVANLVAACCIAYYFMNKEGFIKF